MPMMRRGPLDRYTPEWVLRQANAHQAEGSIEFHTEQPITLYLHGGRVYAGEVGVNLTEADLAERPATPEHAARDQLITLLAGIMGAESGWYFHDPLGQHPSRGAWAWETATLLMDVRTQTHERRSLSAWNDRTVGLQAAATGTVTLGADAWAIVVQLAGSADAAALRGRLGWSPDRLASALTEIEDHELLVSAPTRTAPAPLATRPATAPAPPGSPSRPAPPVAQPVPPVVRPAAPPPPPRLAVPAPTGGPAPAMPTRLPPPPTVAEHAAARLAEPPAGSSTAIRRRVLQGRRPGT